MPQSSPAKPRHFKTSAEFSDWLKANHAKAGELWVGFYKQGAGKTGVAYSEALDEALCYGWIDGVRKRVDDFSYCQRFSPRLPKSGWSEVNIHRAEALIRSRRMRAAGRRAFDRRPARPPHRLGILSGPTSRLPPHRHLLDHGSQTPRNPPTPARVVDQGVRNGTSFGHIDRLVSETGLIIGTAHRSTGQFL